MKAQGRAPGPAVAPQEAEEPLVPGEQKWYERKFSLEAAEEMKKFKKDEPAFLHPGPTPGPTPPGPIRYEGPPPPPMPTRRLPPGSRPPPPPRPAPAAATLEAGRGPWNALPPAWLMKTVIPGKEEKEEVEKEEEDKEEEKSAKKKKKAQEREGAITIFMEDMKQSVQEIMTGTESGRRGAAAFRDLPKRMKREYVLRAGERAAAAAAVPAAAAQAAQQQQSGVPGGGVPGGVPADPGSGTAAAERDDESDSMSNSGIPGGVPGSGTAAGLAGEPERDDDGMSIKSSGTNDSNSSSLGFDPPGQRERLLAQTAAALWLDEQSGATIALLVKRAARNAFAELEEDDTDEERGQNYYLAKAEEVLQTMFQAEADKEQQAEAAAQAMFRAEAKAAAATETLPSREMPLAATAVVHAEANAEAVKEVAVELYKEGLLRMDPVHFDHMLEGDVAEYCVQGFDELEVEEKAQYMATARRQMEFVSRAAREGGETVNAEQPLPPPTASAPTEVPPVTQTPPNADNDDDKKMDDLDPLARHPPPQED